jgi:hypothetical protein
MVGALPNVVVAHPNVVGLYRYFVRAHLTIVNLVTSLPQGHLSIRWRCCGALKTARMIRMSESRLQMHRGRQWNTQLGILMAQ